MRSSSGLARWPAQAVLPADGPTVAMYFQVIMDKAKTVALIKIAPEAIAFYQKLNLYIHNPTMAHEAGMVRRSMARKCGITPLKRKTPFTWSHLVLFAEAYGVRHQG